MTEDSTMKVPNHTCLPLLFLASSLLVGCGALELAKVGGSAVELATKESDEAAKQIKPPEGKAIVYIIRPFGMKVFRFDVYIDEKYIGATGVPTYIFSIVSPGEHTIKSVAENDSYLPLVVKPDTIYYVRQNELPGGWKPRNELRLLPPQGRTELMNCRLSNECAASQSQIEPIPEASHVFPSIGFGGGGGGVSLGLDCVASIGLIFGLGGSVHLNRETWEKDPNHSWSHEEEFYFPIGFRISPRVILITTLGISYRKVAYDTGTWIIVPSGKPYPSLVDEQYSFTVSPQIRYIDKRYIWGTGYHNRRGFILGIGFPF